MGRAEPENAACSPYPLFTDDPALKARALDENPGIKGIYKTPDNPVFKIFYIAVEEVETFSFAEGPKSYKA